MNELKRILPYGLVLLSLSACLGKIPGAGMAHYPVDANVDTTCVAYTNFTTTHTTALGDTPPIQTIIAQSCQTCHGPGGGAGYAMYSISGGSSPSDTQTVANYIQASGRMLFASDSDPAQSDLIQYGRGYKSHTGGAAFSVENEQALMEWASDLSTCTDPSAGATSNSM